MDLQKLSEQFQIAVDDINSIRKSEDSIDGAYFDVTRTVNEYVAMLGRLQKLKENWSKLDAEDNFLDSISTEMDSLGKKCHILKRSNNLNQKECSKDKDAQRTQESG